MREEIRLNSYVYSPEHGYCHVFAKQDNEIFLETASGERIYSDSNKEEWEPVSAKDILKALRIVKTAKEEIEQEREQIQQIKPIYRTTLSTYINPVL